MNDESYRFRGWMNLKTVTRRDFRISTQFGVIGRARLLNVDVMRRATAELRAIG
jgi:hypothetical protein